jgi:hypothetical protein
MKTCFKCGIEKPLSEYYKHPRMADGHLGKCMECTKADVRQNRINNPERLSVYEKRRYSRSERKAAIAATTAAWARNNPDKRKAQNAVNNAIRDGKLVRQPCEVCGAKGEGHRDDYSKPLEVRWLCRKHHMELHRKF